jgi:polyferredoxin
MKALPTVIRIIFLGLFVFLIANGNMIFWLIIFGATVIAAIFFGRIFCGYICPMNTVMIPAEWISKKLNIQTKGTPKWLKSGIFGWIFLVVSVAILLLSQRLLQFNIPILPIWLVIAVLFTLRYRAAVFHNLICPFGVLQKLTGRFAILSRKVDLDTCIGCKKCEDACPSDAIVVRDEDKKAYINKGLCHQCKNCANICPTSAIHYTK